MRHGLPQMHPGVQQHGRPAGSSNLGPIDSSIVWTTFDASSEFVVAGNAIGVLFVLRLNDGAHVCRLLPSMHPLNGHEEPNDTRSPVTVSHSVASPLVFLSPCLSSVLTTRCISVLIVLVL